MNGYVKLLEGTEKMGISPMSPIPSNDKVETFSWALKMQEGREAFPATDKGVKTRAGDSPNAFQ